MKCTLRLLRRSSLSSSQVVSPSILQTEYALVSAGAEKVRVRRPKAGRLAAGFGLVAMLGTSTAMLAALPSVSNPNPVSFGSQAVGMAQAQVTVTFTVNSSVTIGSSLVLTTGAQNLDYTLGTGSTCTGSVTAGTCTVNVVFTPKAPGQRLGAVQLMDSTGTTVLATALLQGTGTGPAVVFPSSTATRTLSSGFSYPSGVAVDGGGDVYVADYANHVVKEIVAVNGAIPSNPSVVTVFSNFIAPFAQPLPVGLAVDGAGNLYVSDSDSSNNEVYEILAVGGVIPKSNPTAVVLSSNFSGPEGLAVDGAGNVYVADTDNSAVKEIVAVNGSIPANNPTILTLGSGFKFPKGVAVDAAGNVYVADYTNFLVKEIVAVNGSIPQNNPQIRTLGGFYAPSGVDVDAAGNVYVSGSNSGYVNEILAVNGSIPANNPTVLSLGSGNFGYPIDITVDAAGNVFVADANNNSVAEIPLAAPSSLSFATTAVGTTSAGSPQTLLFQNIGNEALSFPPPSTNTNPSLSVNYTLSSTSTCPYLTPSAGSAGTLAPGTCTAMVSFAPVMPGTGAGALTFTDNANNVAGSMQTVPLIGTATGATGTTVQTITFPQPATPALPGATAMLTASSTSGLPILYSVVSGPATLSGAMVTYTGVGKVVFEADQYGNGTYAPAAPVQARVAVAVTGGVGGSAIMQSATVTITTAGVLGAIDVLTTGQPNLDFQMASGGTCTVGQSYAANATCTVNYTFAAKAPGQRLGAVQLVDTAGTAVLGTTLLAGTGNGAAVVFPGNTTTNTLVSGLNQPQGVAVDAAGDVYYADSNNGLVREMMAVNGSIPANPTIRTLASFNSPFGIAVDGAGNVYVASYGFSNVFEIVAVGGVVPTTNPTVLVLGSGFNAPQGVAVDAAGNVYVADSGNSLVKEMLAVGGSVPAMPTNPTIVTLGSGFAGPQGVAVDGAGDVYVADTKNDAVKEILAGSGTIVTVSGFNKPSDVTVDAAGNVYVADYTDQLVKEIVAASGSIAANSTVLTLGSGFTYPAAVAVDGAGNLYVADFKNNAVTETPLTMPPSLKFATTAVGSISTDSPKTLLFQNIGNTALSLPIPGSGSNPSIASSFLLGSKSTCPQVASGSSTAGTLAPGICTDLISFQPTTVGAISGSLVTTDNSLGVVNAMQTVPLSGTGTAATPMVVVTTSPTITYGTASVNLAATVTYVSGIVPTGAFTFSIFNSPAVTATCTVTSSTTETCTATYPTATFGSSLSGSAAYTILGTLAADTNYKPTGGTGTLTVTQAVPTVTVANEQINAGTANTTLSATVSFVGAAPVAAFTFQVDNGVGVMATCTAGTSQETCTASYPTSALTVGQHTITASLQNSTNDKAASGTGTLTVISVTPVVTVSNVSIAYGTSSAMLTATVAYAASTTPTGAFTFQVDSGAIVTAACSGTSSPRTCTASYPTAALTGGNHTITGRQAPDSTYLAASGTATLTVTPTTPVIVVSNVSVSYPAASATLSATVAYTGMAPAPVMFQVDSGVMMAATCMASGSPEVCTVNYNTSALGAGKHTITVSIVGSASYNASSATGTLTITTGAAPINFSVPNHTYGDAPFAVAATSPSTGAFTYSVVSGPATISGSTVTLTGVGTVTLQASQAADANYAAGSKDATFSVAQAALVLTAANATRYYGVANPTFTGTITGAKYSDTFTESFSTNATITSAPGAYAIVPSATGADLSDYTLTPTDGTLTVTKAPTTTTETIGSSNVNPNQSVMLTASVVSTTSGTPTGAVTFYDNGTSLAQVQLVSGAASYNTTLSPGTTHALTVSYAGDTDFLPSSTSASVPVVVAPLDFSFTDTGIPSYTVAPGLAVPYTFNIAPIGGSYPGTVTFTATGLPPGATATFSQSTIAANAGPQGITMTLQTASPIAANHKYNPFGRSAPLMALLLLPVFCSRKARRKLRAHILPIVLLCVGLGSAAMLTGCGSNTGFLLEQPATYSVVVTATSGPVQHSQTVTITVQ